MLSFSTIKEKIEDYTGVIEGLDKFLAVSGAIFGGITLLAILF